MATIGQIGEFVEGQEECYIERVEQFFKANEISDAREASSCLVDRNRSINIQFVEEFTGSPESEFEEFGDVGEHLEESFQSEAGMFKSYFIYNPV